VLKLQKFYLDVNYDMQLYKIEKQDCQVTSLSSTDQTKRMN
jgi:hypothetical protein